MAEGFVQGKVILDKSIDISKKLDLENYSPSLSDGKSLVNIDTLNNSISSIKLENIDTSSYSTDSGDGKSIVNIEALNSLVLSSNSKIPLSLLDIVNYNTDMSNNKSLVNVSSLNAALSNISVSQKLEDIDASTYVTDFLKSKSIINVEAFTLNHINASNYTTNTSDGKSIVNVDALNYMSSEIQNVIDSLELEDINANNYTTDTSDGKSIVNVDALNAAVSSSGSGMIVLKTGYDTISANYSGSSEEVTRRTFTISGIPVPEGQNYMIIGSIEAVSSGSIEGVYHVNWYVFDKTETSANVSYSVTTTGINTESYSITIKFVYKVIQI
jgi:uncharacterized hydantoinase/oxoprolinase family protein